MTESMITAIALVVALIVSLALLILHQRGTIKEETVHGVSEILQSLPVTMGSGLFGKIMEYSQTAVLAVEQLVQIGEVKKDNTARKEAAMEIVEMAALCDDVPFNDLERATADVCIEAAVHQLPRNQA